MKTIIKILCGIIPLLCVLAACQDDPELTTLQEVSFGSTITASGQNVVLSEDNEATEVISFSWKEVNYPVKAPVSYSVQIDVPADTTGASPWANAREIPAGDNVLTKSFMGAELNAVAKELGLEAGKPGVIVVRAKAFLDRAAYSEPVTVTVTPFQTVIDLPSLYVPGDYQGWNPAAAPKIVSAKSDGVYEGYIYIPAGGTLQFKLTAQPDWTPMAYGDGGDGTLIEANYSGGNFTAPSEGCYNLTADLNTMRYTVNRTTWSIIGDATPGGWGNDTQLAYDPSRKVWEVTADMSANGSFKFRANNAWVIDFGVNAEGKLAYADHPVFGYDAAVSNITVPSSGNYTITLDLQTAGDYKYKLKKN